MKINILLLHLLLIIKSTLAEENALGNIIESKTTIDSSNGECKVVNKMLGKDESYDCCNLLNIVECENRHITKIHIENRNITGWIPEEIGNLIYLRELWLDHNQLSGRIPVEIGNIVYLKDLSLGANDLFGDIPAELSKLKDLEKLNLYENRLSQKIPRELGDLPNLWHLDLHNNSLYGEIPFELGNLSKLKVLNLDHNELDITSIPQQIQSLPNLTDFHYTNQREHKDESNYRIADFINTVAIILSLVVYSMPIIIFAVICAWIKGKRREKRKKNNQYLEILNNNNETIYVIMDPNVQPENLDINKLLNQNSSYGNNTTTVNTNNSLAPVAPVALTNNVPNYSEVIRNGQ